MILLVIANNLSMSDYDRYLNVLSAAREPSLVSEMTAFVVRKRAEEAKAREEGNKDVETLIPLSVGVPNGDTFPFKKVTLKLRGREKLVTLEGNYSNSHLGSVYHVL